MNTPERCVVVPARLVLLGNGQHLTLSAEQDKAGTLDVYVRTSDGMEFTLKPSALRELAREAGRRS